MILFLDFDGVCHPESGDAEALFCRVELLWQILRACPETEVVFSTSWRESYKFDELLEFVTYGGGEDLARRFVGATPLVVRGKWAYQTERSYHREAECRLWLAGNNQQHRPWLVLDDTAFWFKGPTLYLVNHQNGLTDADVAAVIARILAPRDKYEDVYLEFMKRDSQERSRALVHSGERTQESMFLISPAIVKTLKIRHRCVDFDEITDDDSPGAN